MSSTPKFLREHLGRRGGLRRVLATAGLATAIAAPGCGPSFIEEPPMLDICTAPDGVVDGLAPAVMRTMPFVPRKLTGDVRTPGATSHGMARVGDRLVVADADNGAIAILAADTLQPVATLQVGGRPEQIVIASDGMAYVSLRHAGAVAKVDVAAAKVVATWEVGVEPIGLALAPSHHQLLVALAGQDQVGRFRTDTGALVDTITTAAAPRALAVVPGGQANLDQYGLVVTYAHDAPSRFVMPPTPGWSTGSSTALRQKNPAMDEFGVPMQAWRAIAVDVEPESGDALTSHVIVSPGDDSTVLQSALGTVDVNGVSKGGSSSGGYGASGPTCSSGTPVRPLEVTVSRISTGEAKVEREFAIADPATGRNFLARFDQPHDVLHHPQATIAFVAAMGTDNVLVLNTGAGDPMRFPIAEIQVGQAPRALALSADGATLYVHNSHGFSVSEVELKPLLATVVDAYPTSPDKQPPQLLDGPLTLKASREVVFAADPLTAEARTGRRIFTFTGNDKISEAGRFACASCHLEGDEDKNVWFVTDGPRQTPTLAGRLLGTGPFNWGGTEEALQSNMNKTIERMGGHGLAQGELAALEQFLLHGLPVRPNPHRLAAGLTEQQQRGKELFHDPVVACASCHAGDATTDGRNWDVGTATMVEEQVREFQAAQKGGKPQAITYNTPSLRGVWHTAPYMHDGSAKTLHEALSRTKNSMGKTSHLSKAQLDDLVAYLKTL